MISKIVQKDRDRHINSRKEREKHISEAVIETVNQRDSEYMNACTHASSGKVP